VTLDRGKEGITGGSQIDKHWQEWLRENYGVTIASEFTTYSLVITMWNYPELNNALEDFKRTMPII
jgi:hypothetical protein